MESGKSESNYYCQSLIDLSEIIKSSVKPNQIEPKRENGQSAHASCHLMPNSI